MGFAEQLDKHLTREPDDGGFLVWTEAVLDAVPDEIYAEFEEWFDSGACDDKLNEIFDSGAMYEDSKAHIKHGTEKIVEFVQNLS